MDKIQIKFKGPAKERTTGIVRIRPDAEKIIRNLCMKYDKPASEITSRIIVAAAPHLEFVFE